MGWPADMLSDIGREASRSVGNITGRGQEMADDFERGDVGKFLKDPSLYPKALWGGISDMFKQPDKPGGMNYGDLQSNWDKMQKDITGNTLSNGINNLGQQANSMLNTNQAKLSQQGGLLAGQTGRMADQSKWGAMRAQDMLSQSAQMDSANAAKNRIMQLDMPIQIGQDAMSAQRAAEESQKQSALWGSIGSGIGTYLNYNAK